MTSLSNADPVDLSDRSQSSLISKIIDTLFTAPWWLIVLIAVGFVIAYSLTTTVDHMMIVRETDDRSFRNVPQLRDNPDFRVAALTESTSYAAMSDLGSDRIISVPTTDEAVQLLLNDEIDGLVVDRDTADVLEAANEGRVKLINTSFPSEQFAGIADYLSAGIRMTLYISFVAYSFAIIIGLVVGLIRSSLPQPPKKGASPADVALAALRTLLYNVATLYVSVLRGIPTVVFILIVAFVIIPSLEDTLNNNLQLELGLRGTSAESVIFALALNYGAFMSETFRAGIQSIGRGQIEASRSLGMNYVQTVRYIILPQALRRILPPLGNDLVAMIKDSSLATVLGVRDITQLAKEFSSATFRYLPTYLVVAFFYLVMTVIGFLLVRLLERLTKIEN